MLEIIFEWVGNLPPWIILTSTVILAYLIYDSVRGLGLNLPPGPRGWPIIGYLPHIGMYPGKKFAELSEVYGEIVRLSVFGRNFISLNSYDSIKECFSARGEDFSGRIESKDDAFWLLTDGTGLLREEGAVWREHRRFVLHTLRDFGFGKLSMEARVQEIGKDLLSSLEETNGKPYDPMNILANATFNVIVYLTTDKNFKADHPDFIIIRKCVNAILGVGSSGIWMMVKGMLTKFLPNKFRPGFPDIIKAKEQYADFLKRVVKEHEDTLDEDNPRDYVDAYLIERRRAEKEAKTDSTFTVQRLGTNLLTLLIAGTETTSSTLYWALRLISIRTDIQEKLHKELDDVVGRERLPSILDRPQLQYVDAFILELLRYTTITPTGVPHTNPAPAKLNGYDIPQRSLIFSNLWAVHNNPRYWPEPEQFDPERFMDSITKEKRRERVIPFAIGKRSCLGESLARMELFLFLTMLLQRFKFSLTKDDSGEIKIRHTIVRTLQPFEICACPRE